MLVKLPPVPNHRRLDLHAEKISSIEVQHCNPGRQTEIWRVHLGYGPLPLGHTFDFELQEEADAWADKVREIVNRVLIPGTCEIKLTAMAQWQPTEDEAKIAVKTFDCEVGPTQHAPEWVARKWLQVWQKIFMEFRQ